MPSAKGKGMRYIPMVGGSGQNHLSYWNRQILRPGKYADSFVTDQRFPVQDINGDPAPRPADHVTNPSRKGGDLTKPNKGGPIDRTLL